MIRLSSALLLSVLLLVAGCNTGSRSSSKSTTAPGTTAPGTTAPGTTNGTPPSAAVSGVAAVGSNARMAPDVAAMAFQVAAAGSGASELASVTVKASGTVDESQAIGEVKLISDDNGNGQLDQGEAVLATATAPAFTADDGSVTLTLATPLSIASGATQDLLVTADTSAVGATALARIGQTIELSVEAAGDLTITSGGQPVTPTGNFPVGGGARPLELNDHLLISEVAIETVTWQGDDFIELFNPTAQAIDLSTYYLCDNHDASGSQAVIYANLPTGANYPKGDTVDFMARFPAGATIAPGATALIALDGAAFQATYGRSADFCARNPAGTAQQLLTPDSSTPVNWVPIGVDAGVYLFELGEPIVLFSWDGQSDLVQDVDYVHMGSGSTSRHDKTSMQVDGPDADTAPSTYLADTGKAQQGTLTGAGPWQRIDFTEAGEARTGGNGVTGHDETSEPLGLTFTTGTASPGTP